MGRKRIKDLESYKFSFDIGGENKLVLDNLTEKFNAKYGPIINMLITMFCRMPEDIKESFLDFCTLKKIELEKQQKDEDIYWRMDIEEKKEYYLNIAKIINGGVDLKFNDRDNRMKKIELKEGYLTYPSDWILLNSGMANQCYYAGVVECRNSEKYGVPHFVFFSDENYDDAFCEKINKMCVKAWPEFQKIIEMQVEPIFDPEKPGRCINVEEHLASPYIGHFHIQEEGAPWNPPFGAVIVRRNREKSGD